MHFLFASPHPTIPEHNQIQGKVVYLLILIALVQFSHPITATGNLVPLLLYQVMYASMIVVGIIIGRDTPRHAVFLTLSGLSYLVCGTVYSFFPTQQWSILLAYLALIPYQMLIISILLRYVFNAHHVTRDVLYAATAAYLMLGALFVPVYGLLETVVPGSFVDNMRSAAAVQWQQFIYYSYVTLTTAGYGDILPITFWARSLANVEMIIGVLYVTIIMARLVGLYAQEKETTAPNHDQ